jgi:hypothetical protein
MTTADAEVRVSDLVRFSDGEYGTVRSVRDGLVTCDVSPWGEGACVRLRRTVPTVNLTWLHEAVAGRVGLYLETGPDDVGEVGDHVWCGECETCLAPYEAAACVHDVQPNTQYKRPRGQKER